MTLRPEGGERRLLVIGSQCPPLGSLSFLPEAARAFYQVMVDPLRGACQPALPEGGALVIDPDGASAREAYRAALRSASKDGARLLVSLIGHGLFDGASFYYLLADSADADGRLEPEKALKPIDVADEEKRNRATNLDGLLLLVDACYSGEAVKGAAARLVDLNSAAWRFEILSASDDREAAAGCFTNALTSFISAGIPDLNLPSLHCAQLRPPLNDRCAHQDAQHSARNPDDALWLSRNVALQAAAAPWAGTPAAGEVERLTRDFQPVLALAEIAARTKEEAGCIAIVAGPGQGKSALCAALARPEVTGGAVPARFLSAVAFIDASTTAESLADLISNQLGAGVEDFRGIARGLEYAASPEEWAGLGAMERSVLSPLAAMLGPEALDEPVTIAIDGLDRISDAARASLERDIAALAELPGVCLIVTARPEAWVPAGSGQIPLAPPGAEALRAYLAAAGIPAQAAAALAQELGGNWLMARLGTELMRPAPAGAPPGPGTPEHSPAAGGMGQEGLAALYEAALDGVLERAGLAWGAVAAVMGPMAVAGSGPVLPIALLTEASRTLGGPQTRVQLQDLLAQVHQLVVRSDAGSPDEHIGLFHQTLAAHLRRSGRHPVDERAAHRALLAAIETLAPRQALASADPVQAYATAREAEHLWSLGQYERATDAREARELSVPRDNLDTWRRWADRSERALGPDHPATLSARANIAYWDVEMGDAAGALRLLSGLLADQERVLGPEHPGTLMTRHNIAASTGQTGDPGEALRLASALLPDQERVLGPNHRETLAGRANIAAWTGQTGDPDEALRLFAALLLHQERVLGPEHRGTLMTRLNIAASTGQTGDPGEALRLASALLPDQERVLGPEHPDTLATRASVAASTGQTGDPDEALRLFAALLPDQERVLGPEHPETLATRANIAVWTGETGDPDEALRLASALLPDLERVLGPEHPNTLATRASVAAWTGQTGDPDEALRLASALLPDLERVLGPDHRDTLATRANIAAWTGQTGDPDEALRLFAALLPDQERVLGPEHPETLATRANIAVWTGETGDPDEALRLASALLPDLERVLGPEHPNTLATRASVAAWTGQTGDPDEALRLASALLPDLERVLGPDHRDTLATRANIAAWTGQTGDPDEALRLASALLPDLERVLGPDHDDTFTTRLYIAGLGAE